jgi:hypothetical protein
MVQGTKRQTVSDMRFSLGVGVGDDMGCIKQFFVSKAAERALPPICLKHSLPERSLVQTYPYLCGYIRPSRRVGGVINIGFGVGVCRQAQMLSVVYGD